MNDKKHSAIREEENLSSNNYHENNNFSTSIKSKSFADDREFIKTHYNQIDNKNPSERRLLRNYNIRNAHNFIKSCLYLEYIKEGDKVLDFGVGKGGDLGKYNQVKISELYGIDIAHKSILDALDRARRLNLHYKLTLKTGDCYGSKLNIKKKFDVISSQFSFHYCFDKEENLITTIQNMSSHLEPNGRVIITIPSKEEIMRRKHNNKLSNRLYKIEFESEVFSSVYGNSYFYSLADSIDRCIEYLVDIDTLNVKMEEYGLFLIEETSFYDFFEEFKFNDLYHRMNVEELTNDEYEVMSLYCILVYELKN